MNTAANLDRYGQLLAEAAGIRGVSLARDGWRRLRRNRVALASLVFLVTLSLLAFLTPLLPLQSPYEVDTNAIFSPPTASPLFINSLKIDENLVPAESSLASAGVARADWINKQFGDINGFNRALVKVRVT